MKCKGFTKKGTNCRNYAMVGEEYCRVHLGKQSPSKEKPSSPKRQSPSKEKSPSPKRQSPSKEKSPSPKRQSPSKEEGVATKQEYESFLRDHRKAKKQIEILRTAIAAKRLDIVKYLVVSGTINIREYPDILGYTVDEGNLETLKYLVRIMGDRWVGEYDTYERLLLKAVLRRKMDIIEYLFDELGFTVEDVRALNYRALSRALMIGGETMYQYLVRKGITKSEIERIYYTNPQIEIGDYVLALRTAKDD